MDGNETALRGSLLTGPLGGGAGNRTASTRETLAIPVIRAVRGPSESPTFPEVSKPHPQGGGQPPRDSVLALLGVLRVV